MLIESGTGDESGWNRRNTFRNFWSNTHTNINLKVQVNYSINEHLDFDLWSKSYKMMNMILPQFKESLLDLLSILTSFIIIIII